MTNTPLLDLEFELEQKPINISNIKHAICASHRYLTRHLKQHCLNNLSDLNENNLKTCIIDLFSKYKFSYDEILQIEKYLSCSKLNLTTLYI